MQQHPIPQNISSYEFQLIGNMTLKQFFELLAGGLVAFLFYITNLPFVLKLPLIILSVLAGAAFAFVPFEGRPLDRWLLAFIQAIYRPQEFFWKKSPTLPGFFTYKPKPAEPLPSPQQTLSRQPPPVPTPTPPTRPQEINDRLSQINQLFQQSSPSPTPTPPPKETPTLTFTPPKPLSPPPTQQVKIHRAPPPSPLIDQNATTPTPPPAHPTPKQHRAPKAIIDTPTTRAPSTTLPFPSVPEQSNVVVGMVLDENGGIIDNAVIEVRDAKNNPVRATKTNQLGQFFSVTPLPNGSYSIRVEKDGHRFAIMSLQLEGAIVPPLEIRALKPSS